MAEAVGLASGLLTLIIFAHDTSKSLCSQRFVSRLNARKKFSGSTFFVSHWSVAHQHAEKCAKCLMRVQQTRRAGQASVRDWLKMRHREKSFDDMKNRLASYKSTLAIAFQSINIQDHSVTQDSLGDLKNLISGTREDLEDQLDQVRQTISAADASLREILQDDQARLQSSLDSIARAQRVADTTHPKVIVERNRAGLGSHAIFGTDTSQPRFSVRVADNSAGSGAVVSAGVHSPQTLQALLRNSRTPDLALALQALQTQPPSTRNEAVQSVLNNLSAERNREVADISETNLLSGQRTPEDADRTGFSESPRRSVASVYGIIGKDGKALERPNE